MLCLASSQLRLLTSIRDPDWLVSQMKASFGVQKCLFLLVSFSVNWIGGGVDAMSLLCQLEESQVPDAWQWDEPLSWAESGLSYRGQCGF